MVSEHFKTRMNEQKFDLNNLAIMVLELMVATVVDWPLVSCKKKK